jgi:hypothetical protein
MRRSYIFYFKEWALTLLLILFEFTLDLRGKKNKYYFMK